MFVTKHDLTEIGEVYRGGSWDKSFSPKRDDEKR